MCSAGSIVLTTYPQNALRPQGRKVWNASDHSRVVACWADDPVQGPNPTTQPNDPTQRPNPTTQPNDPTQRHNPTPTTQSSCRGRLQTLRRDHLFPVLLRKSGESS